MTMDEPVRLIRGGSPEAQVLLRAAGGDGPSAAALARLAAKLPTATAAGAGAGAAGFGVKAWLASALVGGALVTGGIAWRAASSSPRVAEVAPAQVAPAQVASPSLAPESLAAAPAPVIAVEPTPIAGAAEPGSPRRGPPRARTAVEPGGPAKIAPAPSAVEPHATIAEPAPIAVEPAPIAIEPAPTAVEPAPTAPTPPGEIELLARAQAALRSGQLERALATVADHTRHHPDGAMTEEREAIAIEALARLAHGDAARARLARFVARFPRSGYRARLDRLVADAWVR